MRLTVNLDDELYAVAKAVASANGCSLSSAVNRLLRRCLEPPIPASREENGIPVVRCRRRFTSEDVERLEALDDAR